MITGRVPFDGESSQEIIMKHLTAEPDLSGVPQPYRAIIQRALQKDPEKRSTTPTTWSAALAPPLAGTKPGPDGNLRRRQRKPEPALYRRRLRRHRVRPPASPCSKYSRRC